MLSSNNTSSNPKLLFGLLIAGGLLFNWLFWNEKIGLNMLLFSLFLLTGLVLRRRPEISRGPSVIILVVALISIVAVVYSNTALSKISAALTMLLFSAYALYGHRSVLYAGGSVVGNILMAPATLAQELSRQSRPKIRRSSGLKNWRLVLIPILIVSVFFLIYSSANPVVNELVQRVTEIFQYLVRFVQTLFSWQRLLLVFAGCYIAATFFMEARLRYFASKDSLSNDALQRIRMRRRPGFISTLLLGKMASHHLAIKHEYRIGLLSLVLLNILIFIVNIIDISYIWINFQPDPTVPIYKMVHEGTELLIISILLAMAVVLGFFRGNLNFYKQNTSLKVAAYAWIIQNFILVVSVCIRDIYYIQAHGLAYKRLGVLFFLFVVTMGLITLMIKVSSKRSGYYLFRTNSLALIILLSFSSLVPWDRIIATYNLEHHSGAVDQGFLLSLSDQALPVLDRNAARFTGSDSNTGERNQLAVETTLDRRKQEFLLKQQRYSWLSWNVSDQWVSNYFNHSNISRP